MNSTRSAWPAFISARRIVRGLGRRLGVEMAADADDGDASHFSRTYMACLGTPAVLLGPVADSPTRDRTVGLSHRPPSEPDKHITPAVKVGIEPHEDGHLNVLIVLIDLDVVETVYDPLKELDTERLIIRSDVDPVPWHGPWVRARRVWNRRISSRRVAKNDFLLALGYSSHTPIMTTRPCKR
jgi:hypothetical protein